MIFKIYAHNHREDLERLLSIPYLRQNSPNFFFAFFPYGRLNALLRCCRWAWGQKDVFVWFLVVNKSFGWLADLITLKDIQNTWKLINWIKDGNQVQICPIHLPNTNHRMVASEDLKNVYITSSDGNILEIQCSGSTPDTCAFKPLASSIRTNQGPHIAFTISDSLADSLCE